MGHRLSKIYTRTGDDGSTGLGDGSRTSKDSFKIEAIGAIDELNSHIGLVLAENLPQRARDRLAEIQHELLDLGGELSLPPGKSVLLTEAQVTRLEKILEEMNADLAPLDEFILPRGSRAASLCHVARTVCRRAERRAVRLARVEQISPIAIKYLNRLSDLLFVMCRVINRHDGREDILWRHQRGT